MKVRWGNRRSVRDSPSLLGQTQLGLRKGQGVLETEGSQASVHANHSLPLSSLCAVAPLAVTSLITFPAPPASLPGLRRSCQTLPLRTTFSEAQAPLFSSTQGSSNLSSGWTSGS